LVADLLNSPVAPLLGEKLVDATTFLKHHTQAHRDVHGDFLDIKKKVNLEKSQKGNKFTTFSLSYTSLRA
jgi:hypothetical protein